MNQIIYYIATVFIIICVINYDKIIARYNQNRFRYFSESRKRESDKIDKMLQPFNQGNNRV